MDAIIDYFGAKRILVEPDCPMAKAYKVGIMASTGAIISFLDDDDIYAHNKLEEVLKAFTDDPTVSYFRHNVAFIDKDGKPIRKVEREHLRAFRDHKLKIKNVTRHLSFLRISGAAFNLSSISIRKSILEPYLGNLQEAFNICSDGFQLAAVLASGNTIYLSRKFLGFYRKHPQSTSRSLGGTFEAKTRAARINNRFYGDVELISRFFDTPNVSIFMYYQTTCFAVNSKIGVIRGKSLQSNVSDAFDLRKTIKAALLAMDPILLYDLGRYFLNTLIFCPILRGKIHNYGEIATR